MERVYSYNPRARTGASWGDGVGIVKLWLKHESQSAVKVTKGHRQPMTDQCGLCNKNCRNINSTRKHVAYCPDSTQCYTFIRIHQPAKS